MSGGPSLIEAKIPLNLHTENQSEVQIMQICKDMLISSIRKPYVRRNCFNRHISGGQNYLLPAMDMAKVGGPLSIVKVCTSMLCVKIGYG